jgi:hypothetical protein
MCYKKGKCAHRWAIGYWGTVTSVEVWRTWRRWSLEEVMPAWPLEYLLLRLGVRRRTSATDEDTSEGGHQALDDMDLRADEAGPDKSGDKDKGETPFIVVLTPLALETYYNL